MRPGRFDRLALVLPPDRVAREAILRFHVRGRPIAQIDFDQLARRTENYSGADLAHVCETASEHALEASVLSGTARAITMEDFNRAVEEVRPSTLSWFESARMPDRSMSRPFSMEL